MGQCRYRAGGLQCTHEAAATIEAELSDGSLDVAECCAHHQKAFLGGWDRMQADAARLKASGIVEPAFGRIMSSRVDRGSYDTDPAATELLVRMLEERFVLATTRFSAANGPKAAAHIDLSSDRWHFYIDCRDGLFGLAEFGGTCVLEPFDSPEAVVMRIAEAVGS